MPAMAPLIFCKSAATSEVGLFIVKLVLDVPVVVLYVSSDSLTEENTSGARLAKSFSRASSLSSSCNQCMILIPQRFMGL